MTVDLIERPELRVAAVRHVGPYNQIMGAFGRLGALAGPAGLFQQPGAAMLALYHDDPASTPLDALRSDAGLIVGRDIPLPAGLAEEHIPAGHYARTLHVGPYEQLGDVWARFLGEWLPTSGYRLGPGPSYELYLNDPSTTPTTQLKTELYVPVAKKA
jgi:AraC family transcriptional regulator